MRQKTSHSQQLSGSRSRTFGSAAGEREVSARRPSSATERGSKAAARRRPFGSFVTAMRSSYATADTESRPRLQRDTR
jgi:hypothetical protein